MKFKTSFLSPSPFLFYQSMPEVLAGLDLAGHGQAVALISMVALDLRMVLGDGFTCCRLVFSPFDIQLTPGARKCMGKRKSTNIGAAKMRKKIREK